MSTAPVPAVWAQAAESAAATNAHAAGEPKHFNLARAVRPVVPGVISAFPLARSRFQYTP
jgi:hypothetical protein